MHLLNNPDKPEHGGLEQSTTNRDLLPKCANELKMARGNTQRVSGWGLHFTEKVRDAPINAVKILGIICAILVVIFWLILVTEANLMSLAGIVPGAFVLSLFQTIATELENAAKRQLRKPKAQ